MCCYHLTIQFVSLSCVFSIPLSLPFFLPLTGLLPVYAPLSLSPTPPLPLSPHLMRPHNNTAVVQLFCYLSQTAGSLHSVFLVPFTCLLRQGNEYHLEVQKTRPTKKAVLRHLRLHLRSVCSGCLDVSKCFKRYGFKMYFYSRSV